MLSLLANLMEKRAVEENTTNTRVGLAVWHNLAKNADLVKDSLDRENHDSPHLLVHNDDEQLVRDKKNMVHDDEQLDRDKKNNVSP